MTHTGPMPESAGTLADAKPSTRDCPQCKALRKVVYQTWESSCGGYEDEKYTCTACGYFWWVEGIDS